MKEVELFNAYGWTCDDCGRDNLALQVHIEKEFPAVDMNGNIDPSGPSSLMVTVFCPQKTVKCKFCESEFKVQEAKLLDSDE